MSNKGRMLDQLKEVESKLMESIEFKRLNMDTKEGEVKIHTRVINNCGVVALSDMMKNDGHKVTLRRSGTGITITVKLNEAL